jgi:hypothetical protein
MLVRAARGLAALRAGAYDKADREQRFKASYGLDFLCDDLKAGGFQVADDLVLLPGVYADLIMDIVQLSATTGTQPGSGQVGLCFEHDHTGRAGRNDVGGSKVRVCRWHKWQEYLLFLFPRIWSDTAHCLVHR